MLDPDAVLSAVVASLQSIPELVTALGSASLITGHYFYSGAENSWVRELSQMSSPSMIVGYNAYIMGNFDGMTVFKHQINLCIRSGNREADPTAPSATHLWWMAMNLPISVPMVAPNIRYVDLAGGLLWLFETNLKYQTDELGQDFFIGTMIFNEMGDSGPDGANFLCIGPATKAA